MSYPNEFRETIVVLELSFVSSRSLELTIHIEQRGHNGEVGDAIRDWALVHGGSVEERPTDGADSVRFSISGIESIASNRSPTVVGRLLDHYLERHLEYGQCVFKERVVVDLEFERVSAV